MRKFPWGIIAGISAMIWSIAFIAIVAVYVLSSMMYAQSGGDDGLRDSWWLVPLYIAEAVTGIICAVSWVLYRVRENIE